METMETSRDRDSVKADARASEEVLEGLRILARIIARAHVAAAQPLSKDEEQEAKDRKDNHDAERNGS